MRFILYLLVSVALVIGACSSMEGHRHGAQEMDMQAMMEAWAKLAVPAAPHQQLASLAGSWTTQSKEWMEPGTPPVESTGTVEMTMLLGGRYLQQHFEGTMMGQPYSGIGITAYDNLRQRYVSIWLDTMNTGIFVMEGTAGEDGKTITLYGQHEMPNGEHMRHRAVWRILDSTQQTFDMYGTHGNGPEMKMMEIAYTRK